MIIHIYAHIYIYITFIHKEIGHYPLIDAQTVPSQQLSAPANSPESHSFFTWCHMVWNAHLASLDLVNDRLSPCPKRWSDGEEDQPGWPESFFWNSGRQEDFVTFGRGYIWLPPSPPPPPTRYCSALWALLYCKWLNICWLMKSSELFPCFTLLAHTTFAFSTKLYQIVSQVLKLLPLWSHSEGSKEADVRGLAAFRI